MSKNGKHTKNYDKTVLKMWSQNGKNMLNLALKPLKANFTLVFGF